MTPSELEAGLEAEASASMKRGMALATHATPVALREAIDCFDRAIALRGQQPLDAVPGYRYGLAAGWLNRAEALMALGTLDDLHQALQACDRAIALLAALPLDVDVRVRRRLVIAWQNRGLVLQRLSPAPPDDESEQAFRTAAELLTTGRASAIPDHARLQLVVCGNLASCLAARGTESAAAAAHSWALRALRSVAALAADDDEEMAAAWLHAQHARCRAIAVQAEATTDESRRAGLFDEAVDAVDESLEVARGWEARGRTRFRALAQDLVRFGCRVYHAHQPRFLTEFVLENLDAARSSGGFVGSADMRETALESLWLTFRQAPRR